MKPLTQEQFTLELLADLGIRPIGGVRSDSGVPRTARFVLLQCSCGEIFETRCDIGKRAKSCRQCAAIQAGTKHGQANTKLYTVWQGMCRRHQQHKEYYATIEVCQEWRTFANFYSWAISTGYKENLEIDRINNKQGYNPKNCRWTTRAVQGRNTRVLFAHNTSGYRGVCAINNNKTNPWKAYIKVNNKPINLGSYPSAIAAAKAYDTYVITYNLEHNINGVLHEPIQLTGAS